MNNHKNILLRRHTVETLTGLGRSSIYQLMANGHFPRPIKLSTRSVAWLASDVDCWIDERIKASRLNPKPSSEV